MPKYTFTVAGETVTQQAQLPDDDAAWSELVVFLGELLLERDGRLETGRALEVRLFDEVGEEIASATLKTTRRPRPRSSLSE